MTKYPILYTINKTWQKTIKEDNDIRVFPGYMLIGFVLYIPAFQLDMKIHTRRTVPLVCLWFVGRVLFAARHGSAHHRQSHQNVE